MREIADVVELATLVGDQIGESGWLTIDQGRIDAFAAVTGDDQWIHVDPRRAAEGPYGDTVAHGYLLLSLVPLLVRDIYSVQAKRMGINYGVNRVRFPQAVVVGSRVRLAVDLVSVDEVAPGSYQVETRATLSVEGASKPAMVADLLSRLVT